MPILPLKCIHSKAVSSPSEEGIDPTWRLSPFPSVSSWYYSKESHALGQNSGFHCSQVLAKEEDTATRRIPKEDVAISLDNSHLPSNKTSVVDISTIKLVVRHCKDIKLRQVRRIRSLSGAFSAHCYHWMQSVPFDPSQPG